MGGDVATIPLGGLAANHDAKRVPLSKTEREKRPGKYPYYGPTGVLDFIDGYLFDGLYLLLAEDGSVEQPDGSIFRQLVRGRFWVNNHAHILRARTEADTKYIFYALAVVPIRPFLSGSVQDKLTQASLNRIQIQWPDVSVRGAVVDLLGELDDKSEINQRMAETLEQTARALFKSWFVDFDPVHAKAQGRSTGLPPDLAALFPDRFGEDGLPAGWHARPIHSFAKMSGGKQLDKEYIMTFGEVPVYGGAGLMGYSSRYTVDGYVISVGRVGAYCGKFFLHQGKVYINNNASLIHPLDESVTDWLYQALLSADIDRIKKGAAQPFLSNSDISTIAVAWPGEALVGVYSDTARLLSQKGRELEAARKTLAALRDTLLPKLISGELRIREAKAAVAAVA